MITQRHIKRLLENERVRSVSDEVLSHVRDTQLFMAASSLAYTTILSIIPLLAVSFAVFHAFGGLDSLLETLEPWILDKFTTGVSKETISFLHTFVQNAHASAIGIGGFVGLVFTSMSLLNSIEKAINRIWRVPSNRPFFQKIASYWFFITLGPLALAVALGFATGNDIPLASVLPGGTGAYLVGVVVFFWLYKFVPNTRVRWPFALISAALTSAISEIASLGYTFYTSRAVKYNAIYGSLGAIPILLLWIYIVWLVILGGAALTAILQTLEAERKKRETAAVGRA